MISFCARNKKLIKTFFLILLLLYYKTYKIELRISKTININELMHPCEEFTVKAVNKYFFKLCNEVAT